MPIPLYAEAEAFVAEKKGLEVARNDFRKKFEDELLAMQERKDPAYFNPVPGEVHVSSLSKCLRGVAYEMLGAKKSTVMDARQAGVFQAGNLFEDFVISSLKPFVLFEQREYQYKHKGLILKGRSDYGVDDAGVVRLGENKSMNSKAFWFMEKAHQSLKYQHRMQLNTYMWLERILDAYECKDCKNITLANFTPKCTDSKCPGLGHDMVAAPEHKLDNPQGIFSYISKDDCVTKFASVDFSQEMVDVMTIPTLDLLDDAFDTKNASIVPMAPDSHWMSKYCDHHEHCKGTESA